ncbi:hypothetical protein HUW63_05605 [Myxococcus sp. AM001]|nr:hypothetical protein [Myxococcus sp. AM001]
MASRLVTARELLGELGYSLQATKKMQEGAAPPERDAQSRYINAEAAAFQARGQPVKRRYRLGNSELKALNITPADFHGEWNYVVRPRPNTSLKLKPLHCKM